MIGDREKKDIVPLVRPIEETGRDRDGEDDDVVATVRLLTKDHCEEWPYWRQAANADEKPLARYVAWNPLQAMLLLARETGWTKGLEYRRLPPIVNARLFDQNGKVDDNIWRAMVWGEAQRGEAYTVMNDFIVRSTVLAHSAGIAGFAEVLREKMDEAGQRNKDDEYRFAWATIGRFLANVVAIGGCDAAVAGIIRDTVYGEMLASRVIDNHDYGREAVNCFETLSGLGERAPYCAPLDALTVPDEMLVGSMHQEERVRLERVLQEWRKSWRRANRP